MMFRRPERSEGPSANNNDPLWGECEVLRFAQDDR